MNSTLEGSKFKYLGEESLWGDIGTNNNSLSLSHMPIDNKVTMSCDYYCDYNWFSYFMSRAIIGLVLLFGNYMQN